MNRQQKEVVIDSLSGEFGHSSASFLVGVKGLSVKQMEKLRADLRESGGKLKIAKARLMKLAVQNSEHDVSMLDPFLKEQIGIVFAHDQVPSVAKALYEFSKTNDALKLVAGCFEKSLLEPQDVMRIATLPSREVLLAQLCGTLKAPISGFANVLNVLILRLLWTLKRIEEKQK